MAARAVASSLGKLIEANVRSVNGAGWVATLMNGKPASHGYLAEYGTDMIKRLLESGVGPSEVAWSQILPTACATVPNQAQVVWQPSFSHSSKSTYRRSSSLFQFTQALDFYLEPQNAVHLRELQRLATVDSTEADERILHYLMDGIRLAGTFGSYREYAPGDGTAAAAAPMCVSDKTHSVQLQPGDRVFVSFVGANRDADAFPHPDQVRTDRPLESYIHYGVGPHACLGMHASRVALAAMLKTVCRLRNLRRAPGDKGVLKKVPRYVHALVRLRLGCTGACQPTSNVLTALGVQARRLLRVREGGLRQLFPLPLEYAGQLGRRSAAFARPSWGSQGQANRGQDER